MKSEKNVCLNFIKGISCIAVVLMHCTYAHKIEGMILYPFKFAIPIFFMISGYYCYTKENKILKKSLKIFRLLIFSELLYFLLYLIENKFKFPTYTLSELITKIFFGTFFNGTLWFLYALFYGYISLYFLNKIKKIENQKYLIYISMFILIFGNLVRLIIVNYYFKYDASIHRNFILCGLPFILIGYFIHLNENKIQISNKKLILLSIIGCAFMTIEWIVTRTYLDIYLGNIISSISIFIFCLKNPKYNPSNIITYIGEKLFTYVYIFQVAIIAVINKLINQIDNFIFLMISPVIVVFFTIFISYIFYKVKIKFKWNI